MGSPSIALPKYCITINVRNCQTVRSSSCGYGSVTGALQLEYCNAKSMIRYILNGGVNWSIHRYAYITYVSLNI